MNLGTLSRRNSQFFVFLIIASFALIGSACTGNGGSSNDEESAVELTHGETYDQVRSGVRLVLSHNPDNNSFTGFVVNTTESTLNRVQVEVQLSSSVELGPTAPVDLTPGETYEINLFAKNLEFDTWTAHTEVGGSSSEHGQDGGKNEPGVEGEGEHGQGGSE